SKRDWSSDVCSSDLRRLVVTEDAGEDDRRGGCSVNGRVRGVSWNAIASVVRGRAALPRGPTARLAGGGSERGPEQIEIVATGLRIEIGRAAGIGGIGDQG